MQQQTSWEAGDEARSNTLDVLWSSITLIVGELSNNCVDSIFTVYHMMETGWVKVSSTDVKDLHYQYQEEKLAGRAADL